MSSKNMSISLIICLAHLVQAFFHRGGDPGTESIHPQVQHTEVETEKTEDRENRQDLLNKHAENVLAYGQMLQNLHKSVSEKTDSDDKNAKKEGDQDSKQNPLIKHAENVPAYGQTLENLHKSASEKSDSDVKNFKKEVDQDSKQNIGTKNVGRCSGASCEREKSISGKPNTAKWTSIDDTTGSGRTSPSTDATRKLTPPSRAVASEQAPLETVQEDREIDFEQRVLKQTESDPKQQNQQNSNSTPQQKHSNSIPRQQRHLRIIPEYEDKLKRENYKIGGALLLTGVLCGFLVIFCPYTCLTPSGATYDRIFTCITCGIVFDVLNYYRKVPPLAKARLVIIFCFLILLFFFILFYPIAQRYLHNGLLFDWSAERQLEYVRGKCRERIYQDIQADLQKIETWGTDKVDPKTVQHTSREEELELWRRRNMLKWFILNEKIPNPLPNNVKDGKFPGNNVQFDLPSRLFAAYHCENQVLHHQAISAYNVCVQKSAIKELGKNHIPTGFSDTIIPTDMITTTSVREKTTGEKTTGEHTVDKKSKNEELDRKVSSIDKKSKNEESYSKLDIQNVLDEIHKDNSILAFVLNHIKECIIEEVVPESPDTVNLPDNRHLHAYQRMLLRHTFEGLLGLNPDMHPDIRNYVPGLSSPKNGVHDLSDVLLGLDLGYPTKYLESAFAWLMLQSGEFSNFNSMVLPTGKSLTKSLTEIINDLSQQNSQQTKKSSMTFDMLLTFPVMYRLAFEMSDLCGFLDQSERRVKAMYFTNPNGQRNIKKEDTINTLEMYVNTITKMVNLKEIREMEQKLKEKKKELTSLQTLSDAEISAEINIKNARNEKQVQFRHQFRIDLLRRIHILQSICVNSDINSVPILPISMKSINSNISTTESKPLEKETESDFENDTTINSKILVPLKSQQDYVESLKEVEKDIARGEVNDLEIEEKFYIDKITEVTQKKKEQQANAFKDLAKDQEIKAIQAQMGI